MIGELFASVPGQRPVKFAGQSLRLLDERLDDALGILVRDLDQHHVARMMVDADRPKWRAIGRNERRMLSHREISSRSERVSACLARCRSGGRMPPVGEITEKTDEDSFG